MDDYAIYHSDIFGKITVPAWKEKDSAVSQTTAPINLTVRDLTVIVETMIIPTSSSLSDPSRTQSCAAAIALLADEELDCLAMSWRLRARRGDKEAFGPAHALEVEQRQRQSPAPVVVRASLRTMVISRPWWKFWATREVGQTVTFR